MAQVTAISVDAAGLETREVNRAIKQAIAEGARTIRVLNPAGRHSFGVALKSDDLEVIFEGPTGWYTAGADVLVIDGMEGATGASPDLLLDHTGIPTLSALCEAVRSLDEMKAVGEVQVIVSGGIKNGVDAAKALALGADAVSIGTAALIALNCNAPLFEEDYRALGVAPGFCHHCHTGRCPVGITTQDPELMERLEVDAAADRVFNFLQSMTMEMQMFARACGKNAVHDLEAEDLRALTLEASLITGIPLAGTDFTLRPEDIAAAVAARLAPGGNGHGGR